MLLQKIKEDNTGVFVLDTSSGEFVRPEIVSSWGFSYSTSFDYYKSYGTDSKCELCDYVALCVKADGVNLLQEQQILFCVSRTKQGNKIHTQLKPLQNDYRKYLYTMSGTDTYLQSGEDVSVCGFAIRHFDNNGYLYTIYKGRRYFYDQMAGWTDVCGTMVSNNTQYAYGICSGKLYRIGGYIGSGEPVLELHQIGSSTKWASVQGMSIETPDGMSNQVYGINDGKIYRIYPTSVSQIGSASDWSKIAIRSIGWGTQYLLATKKDGKLYTIRSDTGLGNSIHLDSSKITDMAAGYVICDGELFYVRVSVNAIKVGTSNKWTMITGQTDNTNNLGGVYGICNGVLYKISMNVEDDEYEFTLTEKLRNCIGVYGAGKVIALCNIN